MTLEVCPAATSPSGSTPTPGDVPLRRIVDAGIPVALGADDPLLFGSRLLAQYSAARDLGLDDAELARLARGSLEGSRMPPSLRQAALADVDAWLAAPA